MKFTWQKCCIAIVVTTCVSTMFLLHLRFALTDEREETSTERIHSGALFERTTDSLHDIMNAIRDRVSSSDTGVNQSTDPSSPAILLQMPGSSNTETPVVVEPVKTIPETLVVQSVAPQDLNIISNQKPTSIFKDGKKSNREMAPIQKVEISDDYMVVFNRHISKKIPKQMALNKYMTTVGKSKQCLGKPVFVTMARVKSDLYWQLIENFFFYMYRFGHTDCAVMICISDLECVRRCEVNGFPCYDYQHGNDTEPVFLQIAKLKLFYVGEVIAAGVDVMLLDLDVSFLRDPMELMEGFLDNETEHVRCQMDMVYSMERDAHGELFWFSHPGPNFGLFLVKASTVSKKVFKEAWRKYQKVPFFKQNRVATDQNVIGGALSGAQWRLKQIFVTYLFIGTDTDANRKARINYNLYVPLLDKIEYYSPNHIKFELGATAAKEELTTAIAVHATCYEGSTKLLALKATNAFWDIRYYNPNERTITKPLMFVTSVSDLRNEIRSLAYLAIMTNRSLIIPNLLIGVGIGIKGKDPKRSKCVSNEKLKCDSTVLEEKEGWAYGDTGPELRSNSETNRRLIAVDDPSDDDFDGIIFDNSFEEYRDRGEEDTDHLYQKDSFHYEHESRRLETSAISKHRQKKKSPPKKGGVYDPLTPYHNQSHAALHRGERYWPAFRTIHSTRPDLKVLEPGFYYRIETDFLKRVPDPQVVSMDLGNSKGDKNPLDTLVKLVKEMDSAPRVVLDIVDSSNADSKRGRGRPRNMIEWAKDPLSAWGDAIIDKRGYVLIPQPKNVNLFRKMDLLNTVMLCPEFMRREEGNRACFNKCT